MLQNLPKVLSQVTESAESAVVPNVVKSTFCKLPNLPEVLSARCRICHKCFRQTAKSVEKKSKNDFGKLPIFDESAFGKMPNAENAFGTVANLPKVLSAR